MVAVLKPSPAAAVVVGVAERASDAAAFVVVAVVGFVVVVIVVDVLVAFAACSFDQLTSAVVVADHQAFANVADAPSSGRPFVASQNV